MASGTASAIRPSLRDNRQNSGSPHTPTSRFISSTYSSPGSTFRQEEDSVIIELDPRGLSAGFEGESGPQCYIPFTPDSSRRVGDYRQWLRGQRSRDRDLEDDVSLHELWREDLGSEPQSFDLGLLEDKLERAVREAYNTYLLTEAGTARLVLVLPSIVPLPVLSTMLTLLFERWKYASIALLPRPTMCLAAAGLRSGVVVDFGWETTTVTPIYEYRELRQSMSTRSMKMMTLSIGQRLRNIAKEQSPSDGQTLICDMAFIEDTIRALASCADADRSQATPVKELEELSIDEQQSANSITLPWPTATSSHDVSLPKSLIPNLVTTTYLTNPPGTSPPDDEELPIPQLLYRALLSLTPDVRAHCLPRLIFTSNHANASTAIPHLRTRILTALRTEIATYGWSPVRGHRPLKHPERFRDLQAPRTGATADASFDSEAPPGKDYVEEKLQKMRAKERAAGLPSSAGPRTAHAAREEGSESTDGGLEGEETEHGAVRAVESLGAWVGASLLASLKVKGVVDIERGRFLDHGLAGASRDMDISVVPQRSSSLGMGPAAKGAERTSWTLGTWG